jgi:hypothetical protein
MRMFSLGSRMTRLASLFGVAAGLVASSAQAQSAPSTVTFTKDVAPILQKSCVTCHRPGEVAPMALRTFDEVRPWARSIKQRVTSREMPPWFADPAIGIQEYADNPSLS